MTPLTTIAKTVFARAAAFALPALAVGWGIACSGCENPGAPSDPASRNGNIIDSANVIAARSPDDSRDTIRVHTTEPKDTVDIDPAKPPDTVDVNAVEPRQLPDLPDTNLSKPGRLIPYGNDVRRGSVQVVDSTGRVVRVIPGKEE